MMKLLGKVVLTLLFAHCAAAAAELIADPAEVKDLIEDDTVIVKVVFTNCEDNSTTRDVSITISDGGGKNLEFPDSVRGIPCQVCDNGSLMSGVDLKLTGRIVGYVTLYIKDTNTDEQLLDYPVGIIRRPGQAKDTIFLAGIITMVVFNTLCFGISLDLNKVKEFVKKPFAPSIGVVCQFILMPLIAFTLTQLMTRHPSQELGVFAAGVAPGGGASNVWCFLLGGDIDLSITMTFISTVSALAFIPMWMYTLGQYIIGDTKIKLPVGNMFSSLATVVIPLSAGLAINRFLPKVGKFILKFQKPVIAITVLFAIIMGTYANIYAYEIVFQDYQLALCGICLPWLGGILAFVVALIFRRKKPVALTIGIETAVQNTSVATILLRTSLPQPWADISTAVPILLNLFTPIPFYFILAGRCIYLRTKAKSDEDKESLSTDSQKGVGSDGAGSDVTNVTPAVTNGVVMTNGAFETESSSTKISEL